LIEYAPRAMRQVFALRHHYENLNRPAAARALAAALDEAERRVKATGSPGRPARVRTRGLPGPASRGSKPDDTGYLTTASPPVIVGVFCETANIPGRL